MPREQDWKQDVIGAISVGSPRCNGSCRKPHPQSKFAFRSVTYSVMMATVAELCKSAFCYRALAKASRESALRLLSWMAKEEHREKVEFAHAITTELRAFSSSSKTLQTGREKMLGPVSHHANLQQVHSALGPIF